MGDLLSINQIMNIQIYHVYPEYWDSLDPYLTVLLHLYKSI